MILPSGQQIYTRRGRCEPSPAPPLSSHASGAVQQIMTDLQDSLRFYRLAQEWWRRVRTTDPLERQIRSLRQRLRPTPCFHDEPAIERAVFGQLAHWHMLPELTQDP